MLMHLEHMRVYFRVTLITTNVHDMNVLLACVNSYCQWSGVKINVGKKQKSQAMTINENALLISASFNSEMASLRQ